MTFNIGIVGASSAPILMLGVYALAGFLKYPFLAPPRRGCVIGAVPPHLRRAYRAGTVGSRADQRRPLPLVCSIHRLPACYC